jgi:threonine dehydrogenase-like Zn-dependent dehydrogenase
LFELQERPVLERRVQPDVVEPADPLDDGELELAAIAPDAIGDQLGLEGVDEALGQRALMLLCPYIPELLRDVLEGRIDPGRVPDYTTDLDGIADAYAAMEERRAIKSLVRVGSV